MIPLISSVGFWLLWAVCLLCVHGCVGVCDAPVVYRALPFGGAAGYSCLFHRHQNSHETLSIRFQSLKGHCLGDLMSSIPKTFVSGIIPISIFLRQVLHLVPVIPS